MSTNQKSKPSREAQDVSAQVFFYVSSKLAQGKSLLGACRDGLVVYDGRGKLVRMMKGNYLEAIYRQAERDRIAPWQKPTNDHVHSRPNFMGRPLPTPIGAAVPSMRKPGRPKNIRAR